VGEKQRRGGGYPKWVLGSKNGKGRPHEDALSTEIVSTLESRTNSAVQSKRTKKKTTGRRYYSKKFTNYIQSSTCPRHELGHRQIWKEPVGF